jgi:hypothetical protein
VLLQCAAAPGEHSDMAVPGHPSLLQCLVALDGVPPHQQVQLPVQALPGCPLCYMLQQVVPQ